MNACKLFAVLAAASLVLTPALHAQRGTPAIGPELGIDGAIVFGTGDRSFTQIALPVQRFRVGFYTSPEVEWEPWFAMNYGSSSGTSVTTLGAGLGVLLHLAPARTEAQWYVRPLLEVNHVSSSTDTNIGTVSNSDTQWGFGAGAGVKVPLVDRLGTRFEVNLEHLLASGNIPSSNQIGLLAGFSYYVH